MRLLNFGVRISGALIAPTYSCKQMMENELMNISIQPTIRIDSQGGK